MFKLLRSYNKKPHNKSARSKIKNIGKIKIPFIIPNPILIICHDLKQIEGKFVSIWERIKKTENNMNILAKIKNEDSSKDMLLKQKEYYEYLCKYFDKYSSLYIETRFQFYTVLIENILIAKNEIYKIDVKQFIETMNNDMEFTKYTLTDDKDFFQCLQIIDGMESVKYFLLQLSNKKKQEDDKNNSSFDNLNKSLKVIRKKISMLTTYLISIQSRKTFGETSPLDEKEMLNRFKKENGFEKFIEYSRKLDEEYDRFLAEIELSEN
jgi:hypothetical protein